MKNNLYSLGLLLVFSLEVAAQGFNVYSNPLDIPSDANIVSPTGIDHDSKGNVYITSAGAFKVMKFDPSGKFVSAFGHGVVAGPHGLRVDSDDNIWVTDVEQHVVIKMSSHGRVELVLGQKNNQGELDEKRNMVLFYKPADIAFGKNGDIYVADGYGNSRVVQLTSDGDFIRAWGVAGKNPGEFNNPHNIVISKKGNVIVADRHNNRIQFFDANGKFKKMWDHIGSPWGLDISENYLYVTDGNAEKVSIYDFDGKEIFSFGGVGQAPGLFRAAHGISVNKNKNIWVTEVLNWRVQKFELQ